MSASILRQAIEYEQDVVTARQRSREIAALAGFDRLAQTQIATAVSEISRNAFRYASGGEIEFLAGFEGNERLLTISVRDSGPGIQHLEEILDGRYRSKTGMGMGIVSSRRIMDVCKVDTGSGGTTVTMARQLPPDARALTERRAGEIAAELALLRPESLLEEVRHQNEELMRALEQLRAREDDLLALNAELQETNRGVVALYNELDDKAREVKRADELRSRFFSYMSHEFRTPVNSIVALARILLARVDGPLGEEQERQIRFIERGALELLQLTNDVLDLMKADAGKTEVHYAPCDVAELLRTLRGTMRPLQTNPEVSLLVEEPTAISGFVTDGAKLTQIMRNLVSNALKFTTRGTVRIAATLSPDGAAVVFTVEDTGHGIASDDQSRIFEEFTQVESHQHGLTGTGLGLPLTRRFAGLLGGTVTVQSAPGVGSIFTVTIPLQPKTAEAAPEAEGPQEAPDDAVVVGAASVEPSVPSIQVEPEAATLISAEPEPGMPTVLVIDDDESMRYLAARQIEARGYGVLFAADGISGLALARAYEPAAVVLDLILPDASGFQVLSALADDPKLAAVPVIVWTSMTLDTVHRQQLHHAVVVISKMPNARRGNQDLDAALDAVGLSSISLEKVY